MMEPLQSLVDQLTQQIRAALTALDAGGHSGKKTS